MHTRNRRSGRILGSRETTGDDLDEPHFPKIRPLMFEVPRPGNGHHWRRGQMEEPHSKNQRSRPLFRPSGTEEMIMSDERVEEERWNLNVTEVVAMPNLRRKIWERS